MKGLSRSIYLQIENWLFQNRVLILYGARQVGKTTLCKHILKERDGVFFNAEKPWLRQLFLSRNISAILSSLEGKNLGIIDEAQKIFGIGEILKLLVDERPDIQWIATGSSSFDLANETAEPLTGRKITFTLYPPSLSELEISPLVFGEKLESLLVYGSYPAVVLEENMDRKKLLLSELASDYLYKDVLEFETLKRPDILLKLLQALALQLGSEVSLRELSVLLKTSGETIERYLSLLEKSFVIFPLSSFARNLRKELVRKKKYFFYDLGIRNALIQNMAPISLRNDRGALWENFCILERRKFLQRENLMANSYFWRTYDQKEIDYVEEREGTLTAFEMKWSTQKKVKIPKDFRLSYPVSEFLVLTPENAKGIIY
jgi:predicted AAA+ superfamily ATPase